MPYVEAGGKELYYELHGAGPPLVLVMGLGGDHRAWLPLLPQLEGFTAVIHDNAGVGLTRERVSGEPPTPPYSIGVFAEDLDALLRSLALGPAHVVGVSMGGAIAMELACRSPDLVRSLALVSTWPKTDGWLAEIFGLRERLLEAGGAPLLLRYVALWAWASRHWEGEGIAVSSTEQLVGQANAGGWTAEEAERYLGHLRASIAHDCDERLPEITAPTLVVVGDEDVLTPLRFARRLVERIPAARLELVPGAGHAFAFEDPAAFARLVTAFAAEH